MMAEQARQVAAKARIQVREDNLASHAAVRPWAGFEQKPAREASPTHGRDMSQATVRAAAPLVGRDYAVSTCPLAPTRCPYGGACHACPARVQAKLATGQPGDEYEQEADRIAGQIMQAPGIQVQRRAASGTGPSTVAPIVHEVLHSPGRQLEPDVRALMEAGFGHDFSGVRVHSNAKAAESARMVNALAYTVGHDIVFDKGQYMPETTDGRRLLAHELTHVIQQKNATRSTRDVAPVDSIWEREADSAAEAVASGNRARVVHRVSDFHLARAQVNRRISSPIPQGNNREIVVDQVVTAGVCRRRPETRTTATGEVTRSRAFFEASFCRGGFRSEAEGQLDYSDVIDRFADLLHRLPTSSDPQQALNEMEQAIQRATPRAEVRFALQFRTFLAELSGRAEGSLESGLSGNLNGVLRYSNGQFRIELMGAHRELWSRLRQNQVTRLQLNTDIGPVELRLRGSRALEEARTGSPESLSFDGTIRFRLPSGPAIGPRVDIARVTPPGGETQTQFIFSLQVEFGGQVSQVQGPDCFTCSCTLPAIEYQCRERLTSQPPTEPLRQTWYVPLFFEYEEATPRPGWQDDYDNMLAFVVDRLAEGYTIARIEGRTSPEGLLRHRSGGRFEGNISLAERRAREAQADLNRAIDGRLAALMLRIRDVTTTSQRLQNARSSGYPVEGHAPGGPPSSAELFGSTGQGEIPEREVFSHLTTVLRAPSPGQTDPLEEALVIGASLPLQIRARVQSEVDAFRSRQREGQRLSESQTLETIYAVFRRAIIVLNPPITLRLSLTQADVERIIGRPVPCQDEYTSAFANRPIPRTWLFEDHCGGVTAPESRGESQ